MSLPNKQHIHNGMKLPRFKAGRDHPSIHSSDDMNRIIDCINALYTQHIARGDSDKVTISYNNLVLSVQING
jgi:hypothetical protein